MEVSCRFSVLWGLSRALIVSALAVACIGSGERAAAQTSVVTHSKTVNTSVDQPITAESSSLRTPSTNTTIKVQNVAPGHFRSTTNAQRQAAAARLAVRRAKTRTNQPLAGVRSYAIVGTPGVGSGVLPSLDQLYFSGVYPNYANSPLPNPADTVNCAAPNYCGIRKFVDTLPQLNVAGSLGYALPVAVPDTSTFPGSDYYEISLVDYTQKLHSDLPATHLRGYVQTNTPSPVPVSYLGPIIVSTSNRPVRVKFTNALPSVNNGGNLFIPTDTSVLGAGLGLANGSSPYLQNRADIHMHGGNTPWISDGTPHQWTVPASDWGTTKYDRGASVAFVPDMFFVNGTVVPQCGAVINGKTITSQCSDPTGANNATLLPAGATNDPGPGSLTYFYTNQQSERLLFYHDHAYGITRLNVYVGEASGMVIRDQAEIDLINGTNTSGIFNTASAIAGTPIAPAPAIPSGDAEIPLIIQDKAFVPQNFASTTVYSVPLLENGSGYTAATVSFSGGCTTEPTATATVGTMADPFGQMIYGAVTGITMTSAGSGCTSDPVVSVNGDGAGAVAFASIASLSQQDPTWDPALWGGYGNFWFPHVYMTNQWPGNPDGSSINPMGRWDYASWFWPPFNGNPNQYTVRGEIPCPTAYDSTMTCPGVPSPEAPAPTQEYDGSVHQGQGSTVSLTPEAFLDTPLVNGVAYPTLTVDPKPYRFRILSIANERTFNLSWFLACDYTGGTAQYTPTASASCPVPSVSGIGNLTEVGMVPAVQATGFPSWWPNDARAGGVPDPAAMGPSWVELASEGGVLPAPMVIPPTPVSYEQNLRSVTVTNIQNHGLLLTSAERADVIVDFTPYVGKTLILYNDAPAPAPAYDTRNDYYTGDPDQTGQGGAPTTLAGFGPNTRTLMQVVVRGSVAGAAQPAVNLANLNALIPAQFKLTQPVPIVPEPGYSKAYGQSFKAVYPKLQSTTLTFTPIDPVTQKLAAAPVTVNIGFKTIQELFDLDYGRMNATLGTELPLTNYNTQTTIPLGYVDPFTEDIYDSADVAAKPVGVLADGTQIWNIVHNGVDTHAIHFHLYNVQIINRFGWDGTNRPPFPNELGWKDTVRMNPLEMDFVALRPMSQTLPFPVPDSTRLFDVTKPPMAPDPAMTAFGPTNLAAPQENALVPMGWEYVWHCHLLGHEENDMMREQVFQVPPQTPAVLAAVAHSNGNIITFTDKSLSEAGFTLQRSTDSTFATGVTSIDIPAQPGWNVGVTYEDSAPVGTVYNYRVQTYKPDADYWNASLGTGPLPNLVSAWSNTATLVVKPIISVTPTSIAFGTLAYNRSGASAVTITNIGVGTLNLNSVSIPATTPATGFTISSKTCGASLATGASCVVNIALGTSVKGVQAANLVITSNDTASPTVTVPLTGAVPGLPVLTLGTAQDARTLSTSVTKGDNLQVVGWAADYIQGAPVSQVQVSIDGRVSGLATLGIARPDVVAAYGFASWLNSGFTYLVSSAAMSTGSHTVSVVATNSLGLTSTASKTFTVIASVPTGVLEKAIDATTLATNLSQQDNLLVSGWAADPLQGAPVTRVQVLIDGVSKGNAILGGSRPDIATAQNNAAWTNSGWTFTMAATTITAGTHTVTAIATNSGGATFTMAGKSITVVASIPVGNLEGTYDFTNKSATVGKADSLYVSGWAADALQGAPITRVQVLIDGVSAGNATLGIARPDVVTATGKPAWLNSGWNFTLAASGLALGTHTVTATGTNSSGQTATLGAAKTITVVASSPVGLIGQAMDATTLLKTVNHLNNLLVTGWAADPVQGAPISNVQILIDGVPVGSATLGISRPDVVASTGNAAYLLSGWTFTMPASGITFGTHTVTATGTNSANVTVPLSGSKSITVQ